MDRCDFWASQTEPGKRIQNQRRKWDSPVIECQSRNTGDIRMWASPSFSSHHCGGWFGWVCQCEGLKKVSTGTYRALPDKTPAGNRGNIGSFLQAEQAQVNIASGRWDTHGSNGTTPVKVQHWFPRAYGLTVVLRGYCTNTGQCVTLQSRVLYFL